MAENVGSQFLSLRQVDPAPFSPPGKLLGKKPLFGKVLKKTSAPWAPGPDQISFSGPHILQTLGLRPKSAEVRNSMGSGLNQREAWILTPVRRASVWTALSAVQSGRHGVKPRLAVLLVLALTGCSGSGRFTDQPGPPAGAASTSRESAIEAPPTNQAVPNNLSPAARSAVSQSADDRSDAGLLECVTESCRVNCSPKLEKRVRPKWCANFKEPLEAAR